jgi:hypothetical protein
MAARIGAAAHRQMNNHAANRCGKTPDFMPITVGVRWSDTLPAFA